MCALKLLQRNNISSWIALLLLLSTASSHFHFSDDRSLLEVPVGEWVHGSCGPEVNESHFFNFETRMRISPIQSGTSRRDENILTLDLRLRDEIEKNSSSISVIETRSRFIIFILRLQDENEIFYWSYLSFRGENKFCLYTYIHSQKTNTFTFFPQAYMENFEKCVKRKRKKHFISLHCPKNS